MAASVPLNRVYVNTTTVGTGTVTLGTAKSNAFCIVSEAGGVDGQQFTFILEDGTDFEISQGIYTVSGLQLTRARVLLSKIGGAAGTTKISLSGSATVRLIESKEDFNLIMSRATAMALILR